MVVYVDLHIFFLYFHAVRDLVMATTSQRRTYNNDPDIFRYICGIFTLQGQRRNINNFVKKLFTLRYHLETKTANWAPHKVCKAVLKLCDHGLRERILSWSLVCQWFGENQQIIWITATSNLSMYQVSIRKPNNTYNTISHLPDNQSHTVRKYLCPYFFYWTARDWSRSPQFTYFYRWRWWDRSFWAIWCRLWKTLSV